MRSNIVELCKYAQERGGWKTDVVMKKVYTQTFPEERVKVDDTVDSYFNNLVYVDSDIDNKKYSAFLTLFELRDNEKSKAYEKSFIKYLEDLEKQIKKKAENRYND